MVWIRHVGAGLIPYRVNPNSGQASVNKGAHRRVEHMKDVKWNLGDPHEDSQDTEDEVVPGDTFRRESG